MGVVEAAGSCSGVGVLGPGVGLVGAVGEVDDCLAEAVVAAAAEHGVVGAPGRAGGGGDPGCGGEGVVGREAAAGVADVGERGGGVDGAGAGQAGEHRCVGVRGQRLADARFECGDPVSQAGQEGDELAGDDVGGVAGGAVGQPGGGPGTGGRTVVGVRVFGRV